MSNNKDGPFPLSSSLCQKKIPPWFIFAPSNSLAVTAIIPPTDHWSWVLDQRWTWSSGCGSHTFWYSQESSWSGMSEQSHSTGLPANASGLVRRQIDQITTQITRKSEKCYKGETCSTHAQKRPKMVLCSHFWLILKLSASRMWGKDYFKLPR